MKISRSLRFSVMIFVASARPTPAAAALRINLLRGGLGRGLLARTRSAVIARTLAPARILAPATQRIKFSALPIFWDSSGLRLLAAVTPKTVNRAEPSHRHHPVDRQAFANRLTHRKWELGNKCLAVFVSHRHDADEFPILGEGVLEGQRSRRIFLWRQIVDRDGIERLLCSPAPRPSRPEAHSCCVWVPSSLMMRISVSMSRSSVSCMSSATTVCPGLGISSQNSSREFCGWYPVKNMISGPIRKTHRLSTMPTPPWAYAAEVSITVARSHAANPRVIMISWTSQNLSPAGASAPTGKLPDIISK